MSSRFVSPSLVGEVSRYYDMDAIEKIESWVVGSPSDTECWLPSRSVRPDGYVNVYVGVGRKQKCLLAHRVMAGVHTHGAEIEVDHLCGNRTCLNPRHYELKNRTLHRRRHKNWIDPIAGVCPKGHSVTQPKRAGDTYPCRECLRDKWRRMSKEKSKRSWSRTKARRAADPEYDSWYRARQKKYDDKRRSQAPKVETI